MNSPDAPQSIWILPSGEVLFAPKSCGHFELIAPYAKEPHIDKHEQVFKQGFIRIAYMNGEFSIQGNKEVIENSPSVRRSIMRLIKENATDVVLFTDVPIAKEYGHDPEETHKWHRWFTWPKDRLAFITFISNPGVW